MTIKILMYEWLFIVDICAPRQLDPLTGYRAPRGALRYVVETSIRLGERYRRIDLFFFSRITPRSDGARVDWLVGCVALIGLDSVQL